MTSTQDIPFAAIRERAHELWDRNHRPDGLDVQFWLLAERELKAELARAAETEDSGDGPPPESAHTRDQPEPAGDPGFSGGP